MKKAFSDAGGSPHVKLKTLVLIASIVRVSAVAVPASADDEELSSLEEIVVTGVRGKPLTVADSPVAVDVFSRADIDAVSRALGATPPKPEISTDYTFGVTGEFDKLSATLDFYRIDIEDRFYAISTLGVSTDPTSPSFVNFQALQAAGSAGAETIGGVFYLTNAFDTKTTGMDLIATYPLEWGTGSVTNLSASMNYNKSEFDSDPSAVLNAEDQFDFENNVPQWRSGFTAIQNFDRLTVLGRASYYGEPETPTTMGRHSISESLIQKYFSTWKVPTKSTKCLESAQVAETSLMNSQVKMKLLISAVVVSIRQAALWSGKAGTTSYV